MGDEGDDPLGGLGDLIMGAKALAPLLPTGYRQASGVVIHEPEPMDAIIAIIEKTAKDTGYGAYQIGGLLPLLKPWHWDTYARMAGVETPNLAGWQKLVRRFAEKHGSELPEGWP